MVPRGKTNLNRHTRQTEESRRRLSNMTEEERASVLERNRLSTIQMRHAESAKNEQLGLRMNDCEPRSRILQQEIGLVINGMNAKVYTRAFGDGPRNFEPWSSDVDDT
ncbi:hypothetical protein TNCV_3300201 [Trichonephila clavipes]|nr:hypothetical protein TNCV_3300201 [Trichonephila clavipes]